MTSNEMALMANIAVDMQKNEVNDVLDKIKAEIKRLPYQRIFGNVSSYSLLDTVVEIIDKYREEQEDNGFFDEIMDDESDGEAYDKIKEIIEQVKEQEE